MGIPVDGHLGAKADNHPDAADDDNNRHGRQMSDGLIIQPPPEEHICKQGDGACGLHHRLRCKVESDCVASLRCQEEDQTTHPERDEIHWPLLEKRPPSLAGERQFLHVGSEVGRGRGDHGDDNADVKEAAYLGLIEAI